MFGDYSKAGLNFFGAFLVEVILTAVFVVFILCVTASRNEGTRNHAGLFIGLALVFVHLIGIPLTGTSVNPARSIGPAVVSAITGTTGPAKDLWIFIVAPFLGAIFAAIVYTAIEGKEEPEAEDAAPVKSSAAAASTDAPVEKAAPKNNSNQNKNQNRSNNKNNNKKRR
jgi:aquaporin Z